MDVVVWGRGLSVASLQAGRGDLAALALPCVTLRWVITSSGLEMRVSTCMVGSSRELCCEAHFSGRFPDLQQPQLSWGELSGSAASHIWLLTSGMTLSLKGTNCCHYPPAFLLG